MRLSPRCFAVTGLAYSAPWYVNAGFIVGDRATLIVDTGGNAAAGATVHGYASSVRPTNDLRVVNTEKHFDHIGGNTVFRSHGIDVWGHAGIARTPDEFRAEIAEFNDAIPNPVRREFGEARAFFAGTELTHPNCPISADTEWDLGGVTVSILLTPGHTPTNLSVWVPSDRVLYTGDCLIRSYLPNLEAGGPGDWKQWLKSLDRLEPLNPRAVVCGHGEVTLDGAIPAIFTGLRRVLTEALRQGCAPTLRRPAEQICHRPYREL
jgi:glyoxylase-like metal-dependent hydrolase (beta-lactamase superfamily II)